LNISTDLNHKTLRDEFKVLIAANDVGGFITLAQSVKAQAMTLICEERCIEANQILEVYANVFRNYTCENPSFTLEILPLVPPNSVKAMQLLGTSNEIDAFILEYKTDLNTICQAKDSAYQILIEWALSKNDMAYVDEIVLKIAEHLNAKEAGSSNNSKVARAILYSLVFHENALNQVHTPALDEAIASLISDNRGKIPHDDYYPMMAKCGLSTSLMKALETEFFLASKIEKTEDQAAFYAAIPKNPTAQELYWIFRSIEIDGLEEIILFDERIDINEHIEVLRSAQINGSYNDLSILTLDRFEHLLWLDPTGTSKDRRVITFLNAICEQERDRIGHERTAEDIHNDLVDRNVHPGLIRHVKMLRGLALEDALGL
jgi:hypothetical protein